MTDAVVYEKEDNAQCVKDQSETKEGLMRTGTLHITGRKLWQSEQ
jgi:hypothetical protein